MASRSIGGTPNNTSPWVTGGTERKSAVHSLEWESTNQGDGSCSFWMEVADPFDPQSTYPELVHGAAVVVSHTLGSVCTRLYTGYILINPTSTQTGPYIVTVECGGALEVMKGRTDFGVYFTDADCSDWQPHRMNQSGMSVNTSGQVDVRVGKGSEVNSGLAGIAYIMPYGGWWDIASVMEGIAEISGNVSWNLTSPFVAALAYPGLAHTRTTITTTARSGLLRSSTRGAPAAARRWPSTTPSRPTSAARRPTRSRAWC